MTGAIVGERIAAQQTNRLRHKQYSLQQLMQFYAESLIDPDRIESPTDPIFQESLSPAEAAIALVPVFLYFHDDFSKLRQNLQRVLKLWPNAAFFESDLLAVGYTIAQALLETLNPPDLITQLLRTTASAPPEGIQHLQRLQQVEALIQQHVGLEDAVQWLLTLSDTTTGDAAIALAMYCFLSTPGDFRLSILRAVRTGYQVPIVTALTGALSGAYNSTIAIPIEWRFNQSSDLQSIAAALFAQWSGVYRQENLEALNRSAIAAPQVIRKFPR